VDDETTVVAVDAPRSLELLAHAGPLGRARIRFELRETPAGTEVVMDEYPEDPDVPEAAVGGLERALRARNALTLWRRKSLVEEEPPAGLAPWVAGLTARVFAGLSGSRDKRPFHPRGVALAGTAELAPDGAALARSSPAAVVVRLSRGIGLPHPLPDFNGVAVRFVDAHGEGCHQDVLLVSAPRFPVARHLLVPVPSFSWSGFSSVLPYRTDAGLVLLGAEPLAAPGTPDQWDGGAPLRLRLLVAPLLGPWRPAADLTLTARLDDEEAEKLRFDPWHPGPGLVPAGLLNRLRVPAYAASQAARPRA
jgi:hypothetical protein